MKKTPRIITHFKESATFRRLIFLTLLGIGIAVYASNYMTGVYKTAITFLGAMISVVASEQMSKDIAQIGAEDLAEREANKKKKPKKLQ